MSAELNRKNTCPVPNGSLVVIGGAEEREAGKERGGVKMEVLEAFVKLLKSKKPHIEVITTAGSDDPEMTFKEYQKAFRDLGAAQIHHMHHSDRPEVDMNNLRGRLTDAHGVFLAGGDQLRLTALYGGTPLLTLLKERYIYDHLVIAGTSAGAMALSTPMIYAGSGRDEMINGNVKVTTGLEFMKDICVDSHFVDRGRFVRMAQVIASNPGCIGVGIEEDTAIVVRRAVDIEVIGSGVVIFIHGRNSRATNIASTDQLLTIRGLEIDILSKGEKFQIPEFNPPHK